MMMMRVAADAPPPDMDPPENWLSRQGIDVIPGQSFVATLEGQTNEGLIQQFSSLEMVEGDESITVREREREKERKKERERERERGRGDMMMMMMMMMMMNVVVIIAMVWTGNPPPQPPTPPHPTGESRLCQGRQPIM